MGYVMFALLMVLTTFIGITLTELVSTKNMWERLGLSMLLGSILLSIVLMASYQIAGSFQALYMFIGLLILECGLLLMGRTTAVFKQLHAFSTRIYHALRTLKFDSKGILIMVIITYLFATAFSNMVWPISDWDAVALYDFRALLIAQQHSWFDGIKLGYFFHYPPFTSLLHGAAYLVNFNHAKMWYSYLFAASLLVFYGLLRRHLSSHQSVTGVFLLCFAPLFSEHITVAYTNLSYAIFFGFGALYSIEWLTSKNDSDIAYSLIFLGASCWVRQAEPFWLVPIAFVFFTLVRERRIASISTATSAVAIFIGLNKYWSVYVNSLHLPPFVYGTTDSSESLPLPSVSLGSIVKNGILVIDYLWRYLINPQLLLICLALIVLIFDFQTSKTKYNRYLMAYVAIFFAMIAGGTYYFSFTYKTWDLIGGSVTRMSMFIVPLLIYFVSQTAFWKPILGLGKMPSAQKPLQSKK